MQVPENCPKCGYDLIKPVYHSNCMSSKDYPKLIIRQNTEHLHYICNCGYDFVRKVRDGNS